MDTSTRSHRRAVWLIVGLLLALVVGLVCYEANWIRQRRAAMKVELTEVAAQVNDLRVRAAGATPVGMPLAARGANYIDRVVMWAVGDRLDQFAILCPTDDAALLATFADGVFDEEAIERLEQVKRARRLFPEAEIFFVYFTDPDSNLFPFEQATAPAAP